MTRRSLIPTVGLMLLASGCLMGPPPGTVVVVRRPPPAPVEVITVRPGPDYTWIRGDWTWSGSDYVWVAGRWDRPVRPVVVEGRRAEGHGRQQARWQDGRWKHVRGGWVWQPGHWKP